MEEEKITMYMAVVGGGWEKAFSENAAIIGAVSHVGGSGGDFVVYALTGTPSHPADVHVDAFGRFSYPLAVEVDRDWSKGSIEVQYNYDSEEYEQVTYIIKTRIDDGEEG